VKSKIGTDLLLVSVLDYEAAYLFSVLVSITWSCPDGHAGLASLAGYPPPPVAFVNFRDDEIVWVEVLQDSVH
jgi:hypothetical protein